MVQDLEMSGGGSKASRVSSQGPGGECSCLPCREAEPGRSKKLGCTAHLQEKDPSLRAGTVVSSALADCKTGGSIKGVPLECVPNDDQ